MYYVYYINLRMCTVRHRHLDKWTPPSVNVIVTTVGISSPSGGNHCLFTIINVNVISTQCLEMPVIICRDVRRIVFILYHCVSFVRYRSPTEASGLAHVEPSWQEETGEEVHGGPQCHRRRLTCTSQEGYRHDTAWTTVRMEVRIELKEKYNFNNE